MPENAMGTLSDDVVDKIQKLIWAFLRKKITLRRESGYRLPQDDIYLFIFNLNRTRTRLVEAVVQQQFDQRLLSKLFVMRSEVLKWCNDEYVEPPTIWKPDTKGTRAGESERTAVGRHKDDELNKQLCQAIARTLWDFDPQVHPAHMIRHKAILRYGNAGIYKDDETIRSWIIEVDPLRKERKSGRPPAVRYLIDIENGGFNKDCLIEFKDKADAS